MDIAATSAYAKKRLTQVPGLNQKVQEARKALERSQPHDKDGQIAAAQARVAKLQETVPTNFKLQAYSDRGGVLSSASKFSSKRLTIDAVKAALDEPGRHTKAAEADSEQEHDSDSDESPTTTPPRNTAIAVESSTASPASQLAAAAPAPDPVLVPTQQQQAADAGATAASPSSRVSTLEEAPNTDRNAPAVYTVTPDAIIRSAGTHRPNRSSDAASQRSTSNAASSSKSRLQQQQLENADKLFNKINNFMQQEMTMQQMLQQQLPQAAATTSEAAAAATLTARTTVSSIDEPSAADNLADLGTDISTEGWTPELMASLALRFQSYGLPPGMNSMPDLPTMIREVKQQEREAAQQRKEQEDQWLQEQQQKQQARQQSATRHLQLYQLGVQQQRERLHRDRYIGARPAGGPKRLAATASVAAQRLQPAQEAQPEGQQQQTSSNKPSDTIAAANSKAGISVPSSQVANPAQGQTDSAAVPRSSIAALTQPDAANGEQSTAATQPAGTAPTGQQQQTAPGSLQDNAGDSSSTAVVSANQQSDISGGTPAAGTAVAVPAEAGGATQGVNHVIDSSRAEELLQQLMQKSTPLKPPVPRYKSDTPGVPVGASHGHLSPAGLKFQHLPGSKRQVYAQIQDALACSEAITVAEQQLRGLRYAPAGAAGSNQ